MGDDLTDTAQRDHVIELAADRMTGEVRASGIGLLVSLSWRS